MLREYIWLAASGMLAGIGLFTFQYARGFSYFGNNPRTCMNCHVMRSYFDSWNRSGHHAAAACNDCHTPHDPIGKMAVKGLNGFNHSRAFTTGRFTDPIRIKGLNRAVAQNNCVRCHESLTYRMALKTSGRADCLACHAETGHAVI